ncbi:MAG: EamA family transporter [Pseudomonadota bacterium]
MTASRLTLGDWASAFTVVLLWGLNFVAVKTALRDLPPFLLTSIRFLGVALILAPFFRPRPAQLPGILGIALVLGVGHFGLLFFGLSGMDAATTAIVTQLGAPFSVLLAWAVFGEKLGPARAGGLAMAFGGVAVLAGEPTLPALLPLVVAVIAMFAWAVSNVQVKRIAPIDPMALNGWMALMSAPMLFMVSLAVEDDHVAAVAGADWKTWTGLAYTTIGSSVIAYTLWYRLLARHDMNRVVPVTLLGPVIAVAGGVLMLGEVLTWQKVVGGLVTIAGVAVVQFAGGRPAPVPPEQPEPGT